MKAPRLIISEVIRRVFTCVPIFVRDAHCKATRVMALWLGAVGLSAVAFAQSGTGLTGSYFTGRNFDTDPVVRTDATVDFHWGESAPIGGIGADNFCVRWAGYIQPRYSETYTITTTSDDGIRLWINGQLLIDHWSDHGDADDQAIIALNADQKYEIKIEYYENGGGATAQLRWESGSQVSEIVPQSRLYPLRGSWISPTPSSTVVVGSRLHWGFQAEPADGLELHFDYSDDNGVNWHPFDYRFASSPVTDNAIDVTDAGTVYKMRAQLGHTGPDNWLYVSYSTVTVVGAPMSDPIWDGAPSSVPFGTAWSPLSHTSGPGNGTGAIMFCPPGANFQTAPWQAPNPGQFSFHIAQRADANHVGNVNDPIQGPMRVNYTTYYIDFTAAPGFTTQPQSVTVSQGANVTLTAAASGYPAPTYRWQKNNVDIPGATSASYSLYMVQSSDVADYRVIATNSQGSVTSSAAHLSLTSYVQNGVVFITNTDYNSGYQSGQNGNPWDSYASYQIQAGPSVNAKSGADVTYESGVAIHLVPGFKAAAGTRFTARMLTSGTGYQPPGSIGSSGSVGPTSGPLSDVDGDGFYAAAESALGRNATTSDNPNNASDQTLPADWNSLASVDASRTEAVGVTTGQLSIDKGGGAGYSIPLWVSPGTAGMEPKLSLNYSSQGGAGLLGFGWSLSGISSISRGPKNRVIDHEVHGVDFTDNDQFYLDGQRLILVSGTHGQEGAVYHTEMESFTRVVCYGRAGNGPARFRAWTKAGLIIDYGATNSVADSSSFRPINGTTAGDEVLSWSVSRIYDTSGNYMAFTYYNNVGGDDLDQRIQKIDYTGHTTDGSPYATVYFDYEARSDTRIGYIAGRKISSTQRLTAVRSQVGNNIAREYLLHYTTRATNQRSLLTSLEEKGAVEPDGTRRSFPQLTFHYEDPAAGWAEAGSALYPPVMLAQDNAPPRGTGFVDLDGDGRPDMVRFHAWMQGGTAQIERDAWLNRPSGWVVADGAHSETLVDGTTRTVPDWRLPLVSGAPHSDVLHLAVDGVADVGTRFIDFDGDGRVDIIHGFDPGGGAAVERYAYRNTGNPSQPWERRDDWAPPGAFAGTGVTDAGRRLVDINGDGLVDIVWNFGGNDKGCYLNKGEGSNPRWESHAELAPPIQLNHGTILIDVDGDGLADEVQCWYGSFTFDTGVALNKRDHWQYETTHTTNNIMGTLPSLQRFCPPGRINTGTSGNNNAPIGVEAIDLNGDGLVDLVWNNPEEGMQYAYFNTGNGWVQAPPAFTPKFALMRSHTPTGSALVDLNGDGFIDQVVAIPSSPPPVSNTDEDGNPVPSDPYTYNLNDPPALYFGSAVGWSSNNYARSGTYNDVDANYALPYQLSKGGGSDKPTGADFIDLNGDGYVDEVWNLNNTTKGARINQSRGSDRLVSVTSGLGVTATIHYKPLTDPSVYLKATDLLGIDSAEQSKVANVTGPMYVVSSVDNDDGTGGQYSVSYHYIGLRSHRDRGSLGFQTTQVTDSRTHITTVTTVAQNYPYIGMPIASYTQHTDSSGDARDLSSSTSYYASRTITGGTLFVFATQTNQQSWDLATTASRTHPASGLPQVANVTTQFYETDQNDGYDDYGNALYVSLDSGDGYAKVTRSYYTNDVTAANESIPGAAGASHWFLGRLTSSNVTSTGPNVDQGAYGIPTSITRKSSFTYDTDTGLLKTETVEPNNSDASVTVTTTYGYDKWGNKTTATTTGLGLGGNNATIGSRTTTSDYEAFGGRFPAWTKNALGHPETYTYDATLGVVTSLTGPNGLRTEWKYDGFGRKVQEDRPDPDGATRSYASDTDAVSRTSIRYGWASSNLRPTGTSYFIETRVSGGAPSIAFYDPMGRTVGSYTIGGPRRTGVNPGYRVVGNQSRYDAMGRAYRTSMPFFLGETPKIASYVIEYDDLGRPLRAAASADGVGGNLKDLDVAAGDFGTNACYTETTYEYNGFTTKVTGSRVRGPNSNLGISGATTTIRSQSVKNTQGWVVSTIRNLDATQGSDGRAETAFLYDPLGQMRVTRVRGSTAWIDTTTLGYDIVGRKRNMTDSSMGYWSYEYNAAGDLISQTDPKNRVTKLEYDVLGRMVKRTEPATAVGDSDIVTQWTYDTASHTVQSGQSLPVFPIVTNLTYSTPGSWVGKLSTVSVSADRNRSYSETYTFDTAGRSSSVARTILGVAHTTTQRYDGYGRPVLTIYPGPTVAAGYAVRTVIDRYGFVLEVRDGRDQPNLALSSQNLQNEIAGGFLYWQAEDYTIWGLSAATLGNGLTTDRQYTAPTGRLTAIATGIGAATDVQFTRYDYDSFGNVSSREELATGRNETFDYDNLDRIITHRTINGSQVTVQYDSLGNIRSKSDNGGTYAYSDSSHPYRLSTANGRSYVYDELGNVTTDGDRSYTYATSGQMQKIQRSSQSAEFWFGASHERVIQQKSDGTSIVYVGPLMEMVINTSNNAVLQTRYFIMTPMGRTAVRTENGATTYIETRWLHQDALGSVVAQTNEWGQVERRFSYDAWGKQSSSVALGQSGQPAMATGAVLAAPTTRGFTDHEMLTDLGLIHMNGRVYDPTLGRFLSADPFVGNPGDSQDYNRYSYLGNNPLGGTDPSGYFKLSLKQIVTIVAVVVISVVTYGAASGWAYAAGSAATATSAGTAATGVLASSVAAGTISASTAGVLAAGIGGAAAGFASGFAGSLLNGGSIGDAFKAGVIGGAIGGVTGGFGKYLSGFDKANPYIARFSAGALRGGIETGDFEGALRGGLVNLVPTDLGLGDAYKNNMAVNFAVNTVRNAGQGYAINGRVGAERSVIGSWANSAVGHGLGLISSGGEGPTFKDGMYFYASKSATGQWLTQHAYDAITFGNVVNTTQSVIDAGYGSNPYPGSYAYQGTRYGRDPHWTYAHEIDHFQTQDILGPYYIPLHGISQGLGSAGEAVNGSRAGYYLEQWPFKLLPYGNP